MRPVRALIVDDSSSMRAVLNRILSADSDIEVVGMAPEPHAARAMIKELNPDVITLDIEMPGMNGLSFLERIMRLRPMPVVMCSTLTAHGAEAAVEALRLGAVDCIGKPTGNPLEIAQDASNLCQIVRAAGRASVRRGPVTPRAAAQGETAIASTLAGGFRDSVIAIGASTGGVEALFTLLSGLPVDCPPVLVVQHMPASFTGSFAARLDRECAVRVVEATDAMQIERGTVYIAPGGATHMELVGGRFGRIRLRAGDLVSNHRPSVDVLFRSVAELGTASIGAILTGMGSDGAQGLLAMRQAGARTFGQSRESCTIYGMPRIAFELGAVEREVSLSTMPEVILGACRK